MIDWLDWPGSMTQRLEDVFAGKVVVDVLFQRSARPFDDEADLLACRERPPLVREVVLSVGGQPVLAARTIIPRSTIAGINVRLSRMGHQPLGSLLFRNGVARWKSREVALVSPRSELWRRLGLHRWSERGRGLWGRRTLYLLSERPLLVNEVFLPAVGTAVSAAAAAWAGGASERFGI